MTDAPVDLAVLAGELLDKATREHSGRAARTLPHPVDGLRQTVIALRGGAALDEHESPGPASLLVLRGRSPGRRRRRRRAHGQPDQSHSEPPAQPAG
jgi:hypothetical protein